MADREFECQGCGLVIDRDDNASINIENEGRRIYNLMIEQRLLESTYENKSKFVEHPTKQNNNILMDDKKPEMTSLKSSGVMKQKNVNLDMGNFV